MTSKRIKIGFYIIIVVFLILSLRLWQLQILDEHKYKRLSDNNRLRIIKTPAPRGIIFDRNETPLVRNSPTFIASAMANDLKNLDIDALSSLLGIKKKEIEEKLNNSSPIVPVKLKRELSFEDIARIEARRSDFPGLFIGMDIGREYLFGEVGSHVIGYLGRITLAQLKNDHELQRFPPNSLVGQLGVEALFDRQLRGIPGERLIETDAAGRELRIIYERPPVKGQDIHLSIDINIQRVVRDAFGDRKGAFVAIKPDTGEVLALESFPPFNPNNFSRGIIHSDWESLMGDKDKPMLNRAVQGQYPPGSAFKIITAIAAIEEGVITPDEKINCKGSISYGKWTFGCWKEGGHGLVDFHRAIVESCNIYFYEIGRRLGIDKIYRYAIALGLGKETGIELMPVKERQGLIPNVKWKKKKKQLPWYPGDTFNSVIGQGYVSVTPIQMATAMAALTNGGHIYKPSLMKGSPELSGRANIEPETLKAVKDALLGVVNEPKGTAYRSKSLLTMIGGKTGTAQVVGKDKETEIESHGWFVGFAPVDNSEIVVSVFVEHGGKGAAVAAPIAKRAIEVYLKSQKAEHDQT